MINELDHILVFKTNILTEDDHLSVKNALDAHQHIEKWSIDTQDVDCVLRIVSPTLQHQDIIELINLHGYHCTELK